MQEHVKLAAALEKLIYDVQIKISLLALGKLINGTDAKDVNTHQIASGGQALITLSSFGEKKKKILS